jgi:hypothetical protein
MFETITTLWNVLAPMIIGFGEKYPLIFTIVFFMGAIRLFMKPIMLAIDTYTAKTPTKSDDEFVAKMKDTLVYKVVCFILDWAASIKLPK